MVSLQMLIGEEFLMIEGAWLRDYLGTDISKADRIEGSGPRTEKFYWKATAFVTVCCCMSR